MKISRLKEKLIVLIAIAVVVGVMYIFDMPCIWRWLLHIECPGCGITRAYLRLLRLDLAGAFSYNPMFWAVPYLFLYYFFDGKLLRPHIINHILFYAIVTGFLINWILRLVM